MAILPPKIQSYHCICTTLLFASTHTLSSLPRRSNPSNSPSSDLSIILPLPPPPASLESGSEPETKSADFPPEGYTLLLGTSRGNKTVIIRKEDGFERRVLHRCSRCRVVVGYEIVSEGDGMEGIEKNGEKENEKGGYTGKVLYLLPGGVMSTEYMMRSGAENKIREGEVGIERGSVAAFE